MMQFDFNSLLLRTICKQCVENNKMDGSVRFPKSSLFDATRVHAASMLSLFSMTLTPSVLPALSLDDVKADADSYVVRAFLLHVCIKNEREGSHLQKVLSW